MQIVFEGKEINLPTKWSEVPVEKVPALIDLVYLTKESGESLHQILMICLGYTPMQYGKMIRKHFGKHLTEVQRVANAEVLHDLFSVLRWLYTEPMDQMPFNEYKFEGKRWILPEPDLYAVTFGEITDAYVHMHAFVKQLIPGEERLNLLVATVCRPERTGKLPDNWDGDSRETYNEFVTKKYSEKVASWPSNIKIQVLIYFSACLQKMLGSYDISGTDDVPEEYPGQGFVKNQHLLAQKIYPGLPAVKVANAHEVLLFLQENKADLNERRKTEKDDYEGF